MAHPYRTLLATPHVTPILLWALVSRVQFAGAPIALTFLVADWTGSYGLAGTVVGALTLGMAVAGPLRGRMADTGAADRVTLVCGAVSATALVLLCLLPGEYWTLALPIALVSGLFVNPASQIARASWPRLVTGPARQSIYTVDATAAEMSFIVGPLLAAGAVAASGPRAAVALLAAVTLVGAVGFAAALRRAGLSRTPRPEVDPGAAPAAERSLLRRPPVLVAMGAGLLFIAGVGALDLAIVAWARELGSPGLAGALAAIWAFGSLVGGMIAGALTGVARLPRRAFAAAVGMATLIPLVPPVTYLPSPWLATPALFVAGLALAPTLAALSARYGELVPAHRRAEAFGWLNSAVTTGISVAAPVAGWLIDLAGIAAGVLGAVVALLGGALLSLALRSR